MFRNHANKTFKPYNFSETARSLANETFSYEHDINLIHSLIHMILKRIKISLTSKVSYFMDTPVFWSDLKPLHLNYTMLAAFFCHLGADEGHFGS